MNAKKKNCFDAGEMEWQRGGKGEGDGEGQGQGQGEGEGKKVRMGSLKVYFSNQKQEAVLDYEASAGEFSS